MTFVRASLAGTALLVLTGCASVGVHELQATAGAACRDAEYRGVLTSARSGESQRFRLAARFCPEGASLLEFRGVIGGAGLIAGVRAGEAVRLLFPGKRVAIDGPDQAWFWEKWTGAPLDGQLIRTLAGGPGGTTEVSGWTAEVAAAPAGDVLPAGVTASDRAGNRVELHKKSEKPASVAAPWPEIPAGFERRVEDARTAPESP